MEAKKNLLTREGLKKYEDELHELKVIRRKEESRATYQRTQSMMQLKTSSVISKQESKSWRRS